MRPIIHLYVGIVLYALIFFLIYLSAQISFFKGSKIYAGFIYTAVLFYPPLMFSHVFQTYFLSKWWRFVRNVMIILNIAAVFTIAYLFKTYGNELGIMGLIIMTYGSVISGFFCFGSITLASMTSNQPFINKALGIASFVTALIGAYLIIVMGFNGHPNALTAGVFSLVIAIPLGLLTTALIISQDP